MKIEQISVFLENRAGHLAEVVQLLSAANINLLALSLADTSDFGILRLIVREKDLAKTILMDNGFTVGLTTVIAVELEHRPGSLDTVLQLISGAGINVEYMYALASRENSRVVMIFRFDMADRAIEMLTENGIRVLDETTLNSL